MRVLGVSSAAVANTLQTLQRGATVAKYRKGTDLIPIVARANPTERQDVAGIGDVTIPVAGGRTVPLAQSATIGWALELPLISRRNRTDPDAAGARRYRAGVHGPDAAKAVLPALAQLIAGLPPGYRIETAEAIEESAKVRRH